MMKLLLQLMAITLCTTSSVSYARLKLVALPDRQETLINMDHDSLTFISEQRDLQLQKGINKVDFSWKGVALDATTIKLKMLKTKGTVNLINVSFPPNEQALVWEIYSDKARVQTAEISYVLQNIDKQIHYVGHAAKDEKTMQLDQFAVVRNFSGEDFDAANANFGFAGQIELATESGETKRLLLTESKGVPLEKVYVFDAGVTPWEPDKLNYDVGIPMYYVWHNDAAHKLGEQHLSAGKLRVFQYQDPINMVFNGENTMPETAIGMETRLFVSESRDLKVTQKLIEKQKSNVVKNKRGYPVMWDEVEHYEVTIDSYKQDEVTLWLLQPMHGEWTISKHSHQPVRESVNAVRFSVPVAANTETTVTFTVKREHVR